MSHAIRNVRAFGARLDGRSDDGVAVQSAIDDLPASGGTVVIPGPAGIGTRGISLRDRANITLLGLGPDAGLRALEALRQKVATMGPVLLLLCRCRGCTIQGLLLDAQGVNANTLGIERSAGIAVQHNRLSNIGSGRLANAAIAAAGNVGNSYLHNTIHDLGGPERSPVRGLWIGNSNPGECEQDPLIAGNTLHHLGLTGITGHATGARILNNLVEETGGSGIALGSAPGAVYARALIAGNTLRRNAFHGIQSDAVVDDAPTTDIVVVGNLCERNAHDGIWAYRSNGWQIRGNVCIDNGTLQAPGNGICLMKSHHAAVSGNECHNTLAGDDRLQGCGILVAALRQSLLDIQLLGNTCRNHIARSRLRLAGAGICVRTFAGYRIDDVVLYGNTALGNDGFGLAVLPTVSGDIACELAENTLDGNGRGDQA